MIKIFNKQKGFSMVELLIVITIIGVLSTIVLSSLSSSRAKAYDTKTKQQLSRFRTAAEIYFTNQTPTNYGPATPICTAGIFSETSEVNGNPHAYIDPLNLPNGTQVVCGSVDSAYAVKATLYSGSEYWCVDSTGASRMTVGPIGASVTVCP